MKYNAPLYNKLKEYKNRISFAMPGHKGRADFAELLNCDVTELAKTADLHHESAEVTEANRLLSELYGAKRSFILTSGSTTAVQTMITAVLRPGETLLVSADCHMSVINACAILGVKIRVINQETDRDFLIPKPALSVRDYLENYSDIRAVLITSPSYYGLCADIGRIATECHSRNIPLLVDEAHGAHFIASDLLPDTAVRYADMVCQSAHKTLNALTGAAFLHVNVQDLHVNTQGLHVNVPNAERVREIINIYETSSPSYPIAASADKARAELADGGGWDSCVEMCREFKNGVEKTGIVPLDNDDETRLVLNFNAFDITGFAINKLLSDKYGIDAEMADLKNIVLIATPSNVPSDFSALLQALTKITGGLRRSTNVCENRRLSGGDCIGLVHNGLINPSSAFFADGAAVPLDEAVGKIARATVCAYPPGTPVIIMGETVTAAAAEYIKALEARGAEIMGLTDGKISIVI